MIRAKGLCLDIIPWSRTSHMVRWMTPDGVVTTVVKGAVRPKSAFLGQYDLNYTCEILYYARARGEVHALRECSPSDLREYLRRDYAFQVLSGYFRRLVVELSPVGLDAVEWFDELENALRPIEVQTPEKLLSRMLAFEMRILELMGLRPEIAENGGILELRGERRMSLAPETAACLVNPEGVFERAVLVDAARSIGVYYQFHVDKVAEVRRSVVAMISKSKKGNS